MLKQHFKIVSQQATKCSSMFKGALAGPLAMLGLCSWSVAKIGRVVGTVTARCRGRWACELWNDWED